MNEFIEKNKTLLKFYYTALRLSGWILLTLAVCGYVGVFGINFVRKMGFGYGPIKSCSHLILLGILGLGIAQLIKYLYSEKPKPGFVLRNGNKFLYIYVILTFIVVVIKNVNYAKHLSSSNIENMTIILFSTLLTSVVLFAAKALILIGVGQFLKRLIPIIEEHKSLV